MSNTNSSNYMGAFIGSLVGGITIILFDFAGWDSSNYYLGIYSEGWIGTDSVGGFITLGAIGVVLLYVAYYAYQGTKSPLIQDKLEQIYKFSLYSLIVILVLALIFVIIIVQEDVWWWFDTGFYGGAIGSFISTLTLRNIKNSA